eukprot:TRINITY_DN29798_c0_g1_i1.p1 TRINITY_DN29798_c0_g1~~TRINITY_DN29798_c0_g1_i1.p1  ORF type:complete len:196 (+),score=36.35 TRINITY_DN29798_c0_g1_i1:162-749(+)
MWPFVDTLPEPRHEDCYVLVWWDHNRWFEGTLDLDAQDPRALFEEYVKARMDDEEPTVKFTAFDGDKKEVSLKDVVPLGLPVKYPYEEGSDDEGRPNPGELNAFAYWTDDHAHMDPAKVTKIEDDEITLLFHDGDRGHYGPEACHRKLSLGEAFKDVKQCLRDKDIDVDEDNLNLYFPQVVGLGPPIAACGCTIS